MRTDIEQIIDVLRAYESGCNAVDAAALGDLYAEDSILFPDRMNTFEGKEAISGFYHYAFSLLTLKLTFDIDPSRIVVSGDLAFATTTSTGTRLIKEIGQTVPEINRELWTFRKIEGSWKITRYCFNKTE